MPYQSGIHDITKYTFNMQYTMHNTIYKYTFKGEPSACKTLKE